MNLKFWTWDLWTYRQKLKSLADAACKASERLAKEQAENLALIRQREGFRSDALELEKQHMHAARECVELRAKLATLNVLRSLAKHPLPKPELLETLKLVNEETPWWRALHAALNERERITAGAVTEAGISSEEAHFRRGRLSEIQASRDEWLGWHAEVQQEKE